MDDEADRLSNLCTDLVSLRRLEPSLVSLFRERRAGEWAAVEDLYRRSGGPDDPVKATLYAAWLPSADGDPDYAVVVFHDNDTKWSMTAEYNVARLPATAPQVRAGA